ncbi:hypothetical protein AGMMS50296_1270 [Alphaproteobacteria bacterium]|nr:hypothetical protein AGMMS50296_1270 [Alphaproteobacteria bacterium]
MSDHSSLLKFFLLGSAFFLVSCENSKKPAAPKEEPVDSPAPASSEKKNAPDSDAIVSAPEKKEEKEEASEETAPTEVAPVEAEEKAENVDETTPEAATPEGQKGLSLKEANKEEEKNDAQEEKASEAEVKEEPSPLKTDDSEKKEAAAPETEEKSESKEEAPQETEQKEPVLKETAPEAEKKPKEDSAQKKTPPQSDAEKEKHIQALIEELKTLTPQGSADWIETNAAVDDILASAFKGESRETKDSYRKNFSGFIAANIAGVLPLVKDYETKSIKKDASRGSFEKYTIVMQQKDKTEPLKVTVLAENLKIKNIIVDVTNLMAIINEQKNAIFEQYPDAKERFEKWQTFIKDSLAGAKK